MDTLILGVESTCDETAAAIVQNGCKVLGASVASSAEIHRQYGGVFPELACRRHSEMILPVIDLALRQAGVSSASLDAIAVANGPGLIGALLIGLQTAKGLALAWNKPLIGVNHVEAHLYASMMEKPPPFPALGFVLSGGHTLMLRLSDLGSYEILSSTVDDAMGEAFDKVATLLGLPYPGGPALERLALDGNPSIVPFQIPLVKKDPMAFSFSGLKTAALYALPHYAPADLAASFQKTAIQAVVQKVRLALKQEPFRSIVLGGGVCSNRALRKTFIDSFPHLPLFWPPPGLSQDNAVMIAGLAFHRQGDHTLRLEAFSSLRKSGKLGTISPILKQPEESGI
jgi:N6-L-threonylcarbamoyladenine synthase